MARDAPGRNLTTARTFRLMFDRIEVFATGVDVLQEELVVAFGRWLRHLWHLAVTMPPEPAGNFRNDDAPYPSQAKRARAVI